MKKYYSALEKLTPEQAMGYLGDLIESEQANVELMAAYVNQKDLPFYCEFDRSVSFDFDWTPIYDEGGEFLRLDKASIYDEDGEEIRQNAYPDGLQKMTKGATLKTIDNHGLGLVMCFFTLELEGSYTLTSKGNEDKNREGKWAGKYRGGKVGGTPWVIEPRTQPKIYFKPSDIEALAAKLNNQPDAQSLQNEVNSLRAEVERPQAQNNEPKQTRSNPVREAMLDIVKRQPDIKTAEVWARLKGMAENQEWPFVHGCAEGEIKYEDGEKTGLLRKRNVGERLRRIKGAR